MSIETVGRRHYLIGLPYDKRHAAKSRGCKWDPDRKAWWTGKRDVAEEVHGAVGDAKPQPKQEITGENLTVIGRAKYKGKSYLLVWHGTTRFGHGHKLAFRDGSKVFWAKGEVQITKEFRQPMTVGALLQFAAEKAAEKKGDYSHMDGRRYECDECGEWVTGGDGTRCWETVLSH